MQFQATNDQIREVCRLAINASAPVGLGFLHYQPLPFSKERVLEMIPDSELEHRIDLDYVEGRMVKLHLKRIDDTTWSCDDYAPRSDYQSWACVYPTRASLLEAASITVSLEGV